MTTQNYLLNEIVMKETDPKPKTKDEIDHLTLTLHHRRGHETVDSICNYYIQQHNKRFTPLKIKKEIETKNFDEFIKTIGYLSPNKVKALIKMNFQTLSNQY